LREGEGPLEEHGAVLDREEQEAESRGSERMQAREVAAERSVDVRVGGARREGAAAREERVEHGTQQRDVARRAGVLGGADEAVRGEDTDRDRAIDERVQEIDERR